MSRVFGPLRQLGYVVRDIEAAMRCWTEVNGVGPFFYIERVPLSAFTFRGEPSQPDISIALAFSGTAQVELIQQRNRAPSMYLEYLDAGQEGLQHVAYWPDDYEQAMRLASEQGLGDRTGRRYRRQGPVRLLPDRRPPRVMHRVRRVHRVPALPVRGDGTDRVRLGRPRSGSHGTARTPAVDGPVQGVG